MAETLILNQPDSIVAAEPLQIFTADCSGPKEIDDGIHVRLLPGGEELYEVTVAVVDTAKLYRQRNVLDMMLARTEAKYGEEPGDQQSYTPMIDPEVIENIQFTAGQMRGALLVSFQLGEGMPPTAPLITFDRVRVTENIDYREFVNRCTKDEEYVPYGRAAAYIMAHLGYVSGGDEDDALIDYAKEKSAETIYRKLVGQADERPWMIGSRFNEAFMVSAGHLVGKLFQDEGRPAIYRVHDPRDYRFSEFMHPELARYSMTPGLHSGLQLDPYCRVTSPMRRLEDAIMMHHEWLRHSGKTASQRDVAIAQLAVQKLNQRVAAQETHKKINIERAKQLLEKILASGEEELIEAA